MQIAQLANLFTNHYVLVDDVYCNSFLDRSKRRVIFIFLHQLYFVNYFENMNLEEKYNILYINIFIYIFMLSCAYETKVTYLVQTKGNVFS